MNVDMSRVIPSQVLTMTSLGYIYLMAPSTEKRILYPLVTWSYSLFPTSIAEQVISCNNTRSDNGSFTAALLHTQNNVAIISAMNVHADDSRPLRYDDWLMSECKNANSWFCSVNLTGDGGCDAGCSGKGNCCCCRCCCSCCKMRKTQFHL